MYSDQCKSCIVEGCPDSCHVKQEYLRDLVRVVRCKDCKHFAGEGMYCACDIIVQFDHFYCYHAERRSE